jgi:hypothetical protein
MNRPHKDSCLGLYLYNTYQTITTNKSFEHLAKRPLGRKHTTIMKNHDISNGDVSSTCRFVSLGISLKAGQIFLLPALPDMFCHKCHLHRGIWGDKKMMGRVAIR